MDDRFSMPHRSESCRAVTGACGPLSFLLLLSLTAFCRADLLIARPR